MKILVMEDDFTSATVLQKIMSEFGDVTLAIDGKVAVNLYMESFKKGERYDLVCLDIMVPEIDGQEVLRIIRTHEIENGINSLANRSKIVMITALNDIDNLMESFREQCEGYIIKPFSREKIRHTFNQLNLINNV